MKLTVQLKLLPTPSQSAALRTTLETANVAANRISQLAWDNKEFRQFPLHRLCYRAIRDEFPLSSQIVVRLLAKVSDAYKLDRDKQRVFRKLGSISYDARILDFQLPASTVSIWSVAGRLKALPFVCGEKQRKLLELPRGESDLILRDGNWYLNVSIEVPEETEYAATEFLGVDFGIAEIAADSDGNRYSGSKFNKVRHRNKALRRKLQRKGTKSAKRLLKKRARKESLFARDVNHTISKRIVSLAKRTDRGIAIEELTGIRSRVRAKKAQRYTLHSWAFAQLGQFLSYKAQRAGVPVIRVDPAYSSQQCSSCGHIDKVNRKSRSEFACQACGHTSHADTNGAANLRLRGLAGAGAFNRPNAEVISYGKIHDRIFCNPCPLGQGS